MLLQNLVIANFSEKYSFVLQDAVQSLHWNNSQATLHPFVAYFIDSGELCHLSYVIISDCLHHDTIAVYLFQKCFIAFLKNLLPERLQPKSIIYSSDGAASQYKNRKKFVNLSPPERFWQELAVFTLCLRKKLLLLLKIVSAM